MGNKVKAWGFSPTNFASDEWPSGPAPLSSRINAEASENKVEAWGFSPTKFASEEWPSGPAPLSSEINVEARENRE
jgi:hypothetical protein